MFSAKGFGKPKDWITSFCNYNQEECNGMQQPQNYIFIKFIRDLVLQTNYVNQLESEKKE